MTLQPYRNEKLRFIHDDRGRYRVMGDVVWLQPNRAQKIVDQLAGRGIHDALTPVDDLPSSPTPDPGVELSPLTTSILDRVLGNPPKVRREIARALGGPKNIRTAGADKLIKSTDPGELEATATPILGA